jgi:hypothetical protein
VWTHSQVTPAQALFVAAVLVGLHAVTPAEHQVLSFAVRIFALNVL